MRLPFLCTLVFLVTYQCSAKSVQLDRLHRLFKRSATDDILESYKDRLGACASSQKSTNFVRDVGLNAAKAGLDLAKKFTSKLGITGLVLGFIIPPAQTCYFDKLQEMMFEIMDAKISENHVKVLQAKLRGWKRSYADLQHDADYAVLLKALNVDMTNQHFVFQEHKAFSAVVVRDYLQARIAVLQELIDAESNDGRKKELMNQLVQLIWDKWEFLEEAIEAAVGYKKDKVYSKKHLVSRRGCFLNFTPNGGAECKCGHRSHGVSYCTHYVEFWHVPGDGRRFNTKGQAEDRAREMVESKLKPSIPWDEWKGYLKFYYQLANPNRRSPVGGSGPVKPIPWNGNDWALGCDFVGDDLSNAKVRAEDCSKICANTLGCTHYSWNEHNGGTCWMKQGKVKKSHAFLTGNHLCGIVPESQRKSASTIAWNGNWAQGCDFYGNDLSSAQVRAEDCGSKCAHTPGCTHFTWNNHNGGTCWMKQGHVGKGAAVSKEGHICGVL